MIALFCGLLLAAAPTARFAVVVGYNGSDADAGDLRFADDDAIAMHRLFVEAGVESVLLVETDAETNAVHPDLKVDAPPTMAGLRAAIDRQQSAMRAARASGARIEFLFSYSGHGNVDRAEAYLTLAGGRFTRADLVVEVLERAPGDVNHVIIDACRSYYFAFPRGDGQTRTPAPLGFARSRPLPFNTGLLLSTSSDRDTHEWERFQGGIFSHELRSAMRGAADIDRDGRVSYAETGAFLEAANRGIANARIRPDFFVYPPDQGGRGASTEILSWSSESAGAPALLLDDPSLGHVYIENADGVRIADAPATYGEFLGMQLPAERPLFLREANGSREATIGAQPTRSSTASFTARAVLQRGAEEALFRRLFSERFGAKDVATYVPSPTRIEEPPFFDDRKAIFVGGAIVLAGLSMHAVAIAKNITTDELSSSLERDRRNSWIAAMNTGAIVAYVVGIGVSALGWWLLPSAEGGP